MIIERKERNRKDKWVEERQKRKKEGKKRVKGKMKGKRREETNDNGGVRRRKGWRKDKRLREW